MARLVEIVTEDRFRLAAACLLLTSYADIGLDGRLPHPLRAKVRAGVEPHQDHACVKMFREHVDGPNFGGQFYSLSAWLSPAPPFQWVAPLAEVRASHLPPPIKPLVTEELPDLFTSFHEEAELRALWESLREDWSHVYAQCRTALDRWRVDEWLLSFWGPCPARLVFVPNPTDPAAFGFGPSTPRESFALMGPPVVPEGTPPERWEEMFDYARNDDLGDLVIHEFGHTYQRSVDDRLQALAEETRDIGESLPLKGRFPATYAEWPEQLEEIINKAVEAVWRGEVISRDSADLGVQKDVDRFGLTVLLPICRELQAARAERTTLGPNGVMDAVEKALTEFRGN